MNKKLDIIGSFNSICIYSYVKITLSQLLCFYTFDALQNVCVNYKYVYFFPSGGRKKKD